ncbi:putative RNA polymerase II subunit B1 CTD phosphatase RPAP2 homolog [Tripterygium wilfordii]|uniref:putative RNA polymerase II subunit B1 CTD phosphatase RPAP2 homolog n=1 Tax=Tripterygium wilfordii TaxID=458696 RepID=UPI0018F803F5|nr:putative RNA polymerase II subunit B1 CTD phosphatase RPAP2 homolog [Tripterygium wilfordii]
MLLVSSHSGFALDFSRLLCLRSSPAMTKDQSLFVKDTVHRLQLSLLEGIQTEDQLFAAGSLISRADYEDVVSEQSIVGRCGYPLCANTLPSDRPRKGRYRISLKEHKVYDLEETYMYCSSSCVVNSRAFAGSLQSERCSVLDSAKLDQLLRLFGNLGLESEEEGLGKNGDLGLSGLKIQEKTDIKDGKMSLEEWIGPSNAIEGYVPHRYRGFEASTSKNFREGFNAKAKDKKPSWKEDFIINETDFMSAIITSDEYSISKTSAGTMESGLSTKLEEPKGTQTRKDVKKDSDNSSRSKIVQKNLRSSLDVPSTSNSRPSGSNIRNADGEKESNDLKLAKVNETLVKPSLKSSTAKKNGRTVTWADGKAGSRNLCEIKEIEDTTAATARSDIADMKDDEYALRFVSAEACAMALTKAAEAVASGYPDVSEAVSGAGIAILPYPHEVEKDESMEEADICQPTSDSLKCPSNQGDPHSDLFESEDSFYDSLPEGFSLTLSPFATMWNALFGWMTSSSLAYIYGRDECFHEEFLSVNGREYPQKIVLGDGRSTEIKLALDGCLNRVLPVIIANLRLPKHDLEKAMGHLLNTMSFTESLPAFRMKQWQVITLLFIEALSVYRIPELTSYMANRRIVLQKVLEDAQMGMEEYEIMKDLMIPLGRVPDFSMYRGA